jgi:hypothetical protein
MELVDFKDKKLDKRVFDFMNTLTNEIQGLVFQYSTDSWAGQRHRQIEGNTVQYYERLEVFDELDLTRPIGAIGMDSESYMVVSPNIKDGRRWWSSSIRGEYKKSKHMKNMVKVAKENLKPLDMSQAMYEGYDMFRREIQSLQWDKSREINLATGNCLGIVRQDMEHLASIGYTPKSPAFLNIMNYIVAKGEFIDKYEHFEPEYIGVWITPSGVHIKTGEGIEKYPSKDSIPEDILQKICIMDICDPKKFDEHLGFKFSDSQYWVML